MSKNTIRGAVAAIAALIAFPAAADTAPSAKATSSNSCFTTGSWQGWSAAAGGDALYIRANVNDIYRVELTKGSRVRRRAGEFLVNQVRGSNWICSSIDLDLAISDDMGFHRSLFATGLRKLTPAEVAALSPKERP